jgi:vacuolar-type H+-ATPase subunit I/STV1
MGAQKAADYRSGMVNIKGDKAVLGFGGIDKAVQDASGMVSFKGQVKNSKGADVVQKIADEVANWKTLNPADFHTPEGLDALKQKIGGIVESIPFEEKTARMVGGKVYSAIKGEITTQAPTYAKVMKDYSDASDQIKEIERALSLGDKASADTAMRKLQSLSRNNVNTNYGNRLKLAQELALVVLPLWVRRLTCIAR